MTSCDSQINYWAHMLDEAMTDKALSEASYKDLEFLKNSMNLDEFKLNCTLYGIDPKEAIRNIKAFSENGKYCLAFDHFYWFDLDGNEIDAPQKVNENFICSECASLVSLEGAPQEVDKSFDCSYCANLTSLKGAPKQVGGHFICKNCDSLTSLEGAPEKVGRIFDCSRCHSLTSLKGAPRRVSGYFSGFDCRQLSKDQVKAYEDFLKNPTPEHIDNTGHYKP